MIKDTEILHKMLKNLGEALGFIVEREVSTSLLSLRLQDAYKPRIDLMWSLPIEKKKQKAIAEVTGKPLEKVKHLPIIGIEVEGTDPTTKILLSDLANLRTLGAPLGLLVTSNMKAKDMYRRSSKAIRTMRFNLGNMSVIPMEAAWANMLLSKRWNKTKSKIETPKAKKPRGGETLQWEKDTRKHIKELGENAGFVIADPFTPSAPVYKYYAERERRKNPMKHLWDPSSIQIKEIRKSRDYMTESEIDMAWLLPLPRSLTKFLKEISQLDPCLQEHDILYPETWDHIAVIGFELESHSGKHAGGGLINLSSYSVIGVAYTPGKKQANQLTHQLKTYVQALGLQNIFVRTLP